MITHGQAAGGLELLTEPGDELLFEARLYAAQQFTANGRELNEELPQFDDGILTARLGARHGRYQRHEMPVIEETDIDDLTAHLGKTGLRCERGRIAAHVATPSQYQIYVDKAVAGTAHFGIDGTKRFLWDNHLVTDCHGVIVDGHHRWLTACTISPMFELPQLRIDAPLATLLPMLLEFSDKRHERNA